MKRWIHLSMFTLAVLVSMMVGPDLADACPNCKDTLQTNQRAVGYAVSILFMMAMPFTILGGWTVAIWRLRNLNRRANPGDSPDGAGD